MASPNLILKKHARGEYEIGIQTEGRLLGAVVGRESALRMLSQLEQRNAMIPHLHI